MLVGMSWGFRLNSSIVFLLITYLFAFLIGNYESFSKIYVVVFLVGLKLFSRLGETVAVGETF